MSWPLIRPVFPSLDVLPEDVDQLLRLEHGLREAEREEIRIAADRLVDAGNRLSPVDSLLDAVIGLEVLLNPMDTSELAFRVAVNYALLGQPEHRRDRYDRVRLIQKTRNRVVHGGLSLQSAQGSIIQEHADLACACLRDALKAFLLIPEFQGNRRLDADFWLDRLFPPTVASRENAEAFNEVRGFTDTGSAEGGRVKRLT
jgi:hypothetical protein